MSLINIGTSLRRGRFSAGPDVLVKLVSTAAKGEDLNYEDDDQDGLRARSEQAIGELAQALIDSQALHNALAAAFGAREKAIEAQQAAMSALNLSSATDLERLERRLRSFSERLEDVEEQIDELGRQIGALRRESERNGAGEKPKKAPKVAKTPKLKAEPEG